MLTEIEKPDRYPPRSRRPVRRRRPEGPGRVARSGDGGVPVPPARPPPGTDGDAVGRVAAHLPPRGHRRPGRPADRHGAPDGRPRRAAAVTEELVNAFKRVTGKENILFSIADAALARPDEAVREVVFPAVSGGEQSAARAGSRVQDRARCQRTVRTTLRASYTNRLHQPLPTRPGSPAGGAGVPLVEHPPPGAGRLELIGRHAVSGNRLLPGRGGRRYAWVGGLGALVWRTDNRGRRRAVRMAYEIATFQALRERIALQAMSGRRCAAVA
ncbi:hypothetical protein HBB16_02580 [Pseudonocardia sp. MCCB 268]|nr:hypothetical protein [Pseudonocardia cytotoxica]